MATRLMMTIARSAFTFAIALAFVSAPAIARTDTPLAPALAPVAFLLGSWTSADGTVADTGESAHGRSTITAEVGGAAILRRDHTDLFAAGGKPTQSFDQIMLIYPEGATLHADYTDGTHVIHYVSATIVPDTSVVFTSVSLPGKPIYRLTYDGSVSGSLGVRFEIEPPGASDFHPIATGTLHRAL